MRCESCSFSVERIPGAVCRACVHSLRLVGWAQLVTGGKAGDITVWDAAGGAKQVLRFPVKDNFITALDIDESRGDLFVCGTSWGSGVRVHVWRAVWARGMLHVSRMEVPRVARLVVRFGLGKAIGRAPWHTSHGPRVAEVACRCGASWAPGRTRLIAC